MKKYLLVVFLAISINAFAQKITSGVNMDSLFKAKERESIGKAFQHFTATVDGDTISNETLKGKVVFINFWFEACPPCIAELDALNTLYKKFRHNKNFAFLSFTHEKPGKLPLLKKKHTMQYKVISVSDQECYRLNQNNGFPTSIILDKNGIIAALFTGGTTDKRKAKQFIINTIYPAIQSALDH